MIDTVRNKLRGEMNDLADDIAIGACKSYDDYRHAVGKIEGMAVAERIILDLLKAQEDADRA